MRPAYVALAVLHTAAGYKPYPAYILQLSGTCSLCQCIFQLLVHLSAVSGTIHIEASNLRSNCTLLPRRYSLGSKSFSMVLVAYEAETDEGDLPSGLGVYRVTEQ